MIEIKKILVPTDFSENVVSSYRVAQVIAARFESLIDLIHVIPNVKYLQENLLSIELPVKLEEKVLPEMTERAGKQLEEAMNNYIRSEYRGQVLVNVDRKPSETITSHAKEHKYDLIIVGAKGKHESGMFRGSTTVNIIRNSDLPVLTVDEQIDMYSLENIMIPTDSSMLSFAAFPLAASFAGKFDSGITLFHVLEKHRYKSGKKMTEPVEDELLDVYNVLIGELENFLSDSGTGYISVQRTEQPFEDLITVSHGNVDYTFQLKTEIVAGGSAHVEINNHAEKFADLVVMTTHGYSGRPLLDLGSIAEKIAQEIKTPIITIRPAKDLFKKPAEENVPDNL